MLFFSRDIVNTNLRLDNLGSIDQQSLVKVNFHYNIFSTKVICDYLINSEDIYYLTFVYL
jgi:hypothetical protein